MLLEVGGAQETAGSTSSSDTSGSSTGGGTAGGGCGAVRPPDAGPMLVFSPNPLGFMWPPGIGDVPSSFPPVDVTSSSGDFVATSNVDFVPIDIPSDVGCTCSFQTTAKQIELFTISCLGGADGPRGPGEFSLSTNQFGTITIQSILDGGQLVCTPVGEPCGSHGDCCVGLSCQTTADGCACDSLLGLLAGLGRLWGSGETITHAPGFSGESARRRSDETVASGTDGRR